MADYVPKFSPGTAITFTASSDVIGGRIVEITGDNTVAHAAADSAKVVGVAGFDAPTGEQVTVYSGGVQRPLAAATITAGARVTAAADGKAGTGGTHELGTALAAAGADSPVQIKFDR